MRGVLTTELGGCGGLTGGEGDQAGGLWAGRPWAGWLARDGRSTTSAYLVLALLRVRGIRGRVVNMSNSKAPHLRVNQKSSKVRGVRGWKAEQ